MKNALLFAIALLFCLSINSYAQSPLWVQTNGPSGRWISAINFDSSGNVYVIADNLYRSSNDGATWQVLPQVPITLSTLPNGDLLGTFDSSIRISKDNGVSWTSILSSYQSGIYYLATGTITGDIFVLSTNVLSTNLFRSSDEGATWDTLPASPLVGNGLLNSYYTSTLFISGSYIGDDYRSTDQGESWTKIVNGVDGGVSLMAGGPGGNMFGESNGGGNVVSTDDGRTWTQAAFGADIEILMTYTKNGPVIAASGTQGIVLFTPNGVLNKSISNGLFTLSMNTNGSVSALGSAPNGEVWLAVGPTLFKVNPSSQSTFSNVSLPTAGVKFLVATDPGSTIASAGFPTGGGTHSISAPDILLYSSIDSGTTWLGISGSDYIAPLAADSDKRLLAGDIAPDIIAGMIGVMASTDKGATWSELGSPLTTTPITSIVVDHSGNIYMGCGEGVFRSTDKGNTWDQLNDGITDQEIQSLAVSPSGELFAGTSTTIYHSTDLAINWEALPFVPPDTSGIISLTINTAGDLLAAVHDKGIFWSKDDGQTWSPIGTGLSGTVNAMFSTPSGHVFAGTTTGVYYLPAGGGAWVNANAGLGTISVLSITRDPNGTVYLGTDGAGVFRSTQTYNSIGGASVGQPAPSASLVLGQVYPNPLQSSGSFSFSIPEASQVRIELLNVLGEQVQLLTDNQYEAGSYQLGIDDRGLVDGVYYLMLTADGAVKVQRVIIAR